MVQVEPNSKAHAGIVIPVAVISRKTHDRSICKRSRASVAIANGKIHSVLFSLERKTIYMYVEIFWAVQVHIFWEDKSEWAWWWLFAANLFRFGIAWSPRDRVQTCCRHKGGNRGR